MKRILLLATFFLSYSLVFGQVIEKDKRILGGTVNFGFNHNQADTLTSSDPYLKDGSGYINLSPSFGKAIKSNTVFGYMLSLNYSHGKVDDLRSKQTTKNNGYGAGAGVFFEKYFPLSKSLSFSGSTPLQLYYSEGRNETFDNSTLSTKGKNTNYGVILALYPSLNYSLNKKFLLQLTLNNFVSLGYRHSTNEVEGVNITANKQGNSNFGFNTRVNEQTRLSDIGFAFRYIF